MGLHSLTECGFRKKKKRMYSSLDILCYLFCLCKAGISPVISASVSQTVQNNLWSLVLKQGICQRRPNPGIGFNPLQKYLWVERICLNHRSAHKWSLCLSPWKALSAILQHWSSGFLCCQKRWKSPTFMRSDQRAAVSLPSVGLLQFIGVAILSGPLSAFTVHYSTGTPGIQVVKGGNIFIAKQRGGMSVTLILQLCSNTANRFGTCL